MSSPRDESDLYTGLHSASVRKARAKRNVRAVENESVRLKVSPAEDVIKEVIAIEMGKALNVNSLAFDEKSTPEEIKTLLLAKRMNVEFIKGFQNQILTKLRERK